MKKLMAVILAVAMIACFAACGAGGQDNDETKSSVQEGAVTQNSKVPSEVSEKPQEEPTVVRMSLGSEPDSLDPWQSAASDTDAIFRNVFEGLMAFNEKGEIIPGLAESYEVSEDGCTYTFHLRKNVVFHNGQGMTSKDVLYSYNNLAGMNGEKAVSSKFTNVESVEATDDYTFVIHLKQAAAAFLALNIVPILPEGYSEQATAPVGSGPYKFVEYIPGQRVVFEKNEDYYNPERMGKVDRVEVYIMTDASAIVSALMSGQLDLANVSVDNAAILGSEYDICNSPQNMVQIFALNNTYEPLSNMKVRQAMSYAVNKQEVIQGVFGGYATELYSNFSPVMNVYYNDDLSEVYTTDIEKAKSLMKAAGYENGFDLIIRVPGNYQAHVDTAQILQQQLSQINIKVSIETIEWATWLEEVYKNAQYQATVIGFTGKLDPNDVLIRFTSDYPKNFTKYNNPEYDKLIAAAAVELNDEKRIEMYKECQRILTEDAASIYICDPNLTMAVRRELKGYTFYPVTFHDFTKLYYEK
ncbi:MAG: ABC transporter substrate-binding protein [Acetatifactor sp.]